MGCKMSRTGDMSAAGIKKTNVSSSALFVERAASGAEGGRP